MDLEIASHVVPRIYICVHWLPPHISQSITTSLIAPYPETARLPNIIRSLGHTRTLPRMESMSPFGPALVILTSTRTLPTLLDEPRQLVELAENIDLATREPGIMEIQTCTSS